MGAVLSPFYDRTAVQKASISHQLFGNSAQKTGAPDAVIPGFASSCIRKLGKSTSSSKNTIKTSSGNAAPYAAPYARCKRRHVPGVYVLMPGMAVVVRP